MNDFCKVPQWGTYSFAEGWRVPAPISLLDLAAKGGDDLLHAINLLLNDGSKESERLAEDLFDRYA